jgi:hypothetical protein
MTYYIVPFFRRISLITSLHSRQHCWSFWSMLQRHSTKPMINCINTAQQICSGSNVSNSYTGGAHVKSRPRPWLFSIDLTTFTNSNCIASNEWSWKMNWKRCGIKRERSNLMYYPSICLEVLSKNRKDLSKNIWSPSRDSNRAPPRWHYPNWRIVKIFLSLSRKYRDSTSIMP